MWIICCGMQRSGSTLQYNLAREIAEANGRTKTIGFVTRQNFDQIYADTEQEGGYDFVIVKSHKYLRHAKILIDRKEATAVYCYRDIRDAVLSRMNKAGVPYVQARSQRWIEESLQMYEQWTRMSSVLISRYEDMVADVGAEAERIAAHIGVPLSAELKAELAEKYSIESQKKQIQSFDYDEQGVVNPNASARYDPKTQLHDNHIHSGATEQWRTAFQPKEIRFMERQAFDWLTKLGYPVIHARKQAGSGAGGDDEDGNKGSASAERREKIRLARRANIDKSRAALDGRTIHFTYKIYEACGFSDQLDRLRLVHRLGKSLGFTYVHSPFHLPRSSDGLDEFVGLKDHFALKFEDIDEDKFAILDLTIDDLFTKHKFNTLLDLKMVILRRMAAFAGKHPDKDIMLRLMLLRNAQPAIRIAPKEGRTKRKPRRQLRPTVALDRWFPPTDPEHLDFRAIYNEARASDPHEHRFDTDKAKVLVHIRQGDVAIIETPWNTFLPAKLLLGTKKDRFAELSAFDHAGDTYVDVREYHDFVRAFAAHPDCPANSMMVSSDGAGRGFDMILTHGEETGLGAEKLAKLAEIRDDYDANAFAVFDDIPNCQCVVGETDDNLFEMIDAVLSADIIIAGTQQRMVPQILDLYPRPDNPPTVIVLHKNAEYEKGWTFPHLRPVDETSAHFIPARLDALDMDKIMAEVNARLKTG